MGKGLDRLLTRLIAQRNLPLDDIDKYLDGEYASISHPYALNGIKEAAELFASIVKKRGNVAVFGDYDCDGIFSSAMVKELCRTLQVPCKSFIPSRLEHGYGLNPTSLDAFILWMDNEIPDLLIVVDCGINSKEQIKLLKDYGIKHIIVIDHHVPEEKSFPEDADVVVNWHLTDQEELCACGEVYQFIRGVACLTKKVDPLHFIAYAAIGTIADVSPMNRNNRIIVKNGLKPYALSQVLSPGLNAVLEISKVEVREDLSQEDVAFRVAPRLNASGRIFKADIAYGLLVEQEDTVATKIAEHINSLNTQRKSLQRKIEADAIKQAEEELKNHPHGILIVGEEWHIGVVGIVASKVAEHFNLPSIVMAHYKDKVKGSGRSVANIDMKSILDECSEVFEGYGGHAMAVGATLKKDKVAKAKDLFNEACKKYCDTHKVESAPHYYDARLRPSSVSMKMAKTLKEKLYPYCDQTNPEPVFKMDNARIFNVRSFEGKGWAFVIFEVEQNGEKCELPFKFFSQAFGGEIENVTADIYFKFPQKYTPNKYGGFEVNVVDVVMKG